MNDIANESPTQEVLELAAERELGCWIERTFPPVKSMFARRFRSWRLYFFEQGLIISGDDYSVYEWASTRVLESRRSVNGKTADARYTLIDADGVAMSIGLGVDAVMGRHREKVGVTSFTRGAPFIGPDTWGPYIQERVTLAQLPGALDTIAQGQTVDFGPVEAGPTGLTVKNRTAAWNDIGNVVASNGLINFLPHGERGPTVLPPVSAAEVVNVALLLTLFQQKQS